MKRVRNVLSGLLREESGQDVIEYALVAAFIGLGAVMSMRKVAAGIGTVFGAVGTTLTGAT